MSEQAKPYTPEELEQLLFNPTGLLFIKERLSATAERLAFLEEIWEQRVSREQYFQEELKRALDAYDELVYKVFRLEAEPTDEEVEAVMAAMARESWGDDGPTFVSKEYATHGPVTHRPYPLNTVREHYERMARAAIAAYREVRKR